MSTPVTTLSEIFLKAASYDKPDCLLFKVGGTYQPMSTAELVDRVRRLSQALLGLDLAKGDRVALMAENGPHWPTVDFATLCAGGVLVPIYPTLLPDQSSYIVGNCGARVVVAETPAHLEGILSHAAELPEVRQYVLIKGESSDPRVATLDQLIAKGAGVDVAGFEARARAVRPEDLATFIYTSGTTGTPKGVMLTHGNITSNATTGAPLLGLERRHTALSFLPLSHVFERTVDYCYFLTGCTIAYAESVALVAQNMMEVKPHVFVSVPRVYEKVYSRVQEGVAAGSPIKQKLFAWAVQLGRESLPDRLRQRRPAGFKGLQLALADKLVFSKIKARLGGRFEFAISGGAPLARDLAEFFWGAGIPIYEGYGLSETSPVISVNSRQHVKMGTVGQPMQGIEVKIAEDGEILSRGPNIMRGYWHMEKETAEAIDAEGWFHTGDIGELDAEGFLRITDRKKELIINAYGKNVAPAPIENALKASRFLEQAVVIGDRRKFLSALLVPDFAALQPWADKQGIAAASREQLIADPKVREQIGHEVAAVNANLAGFEQIVAWELLPDEFTLETGELTPTQKIKRRVINQKYGPIIDRLYAEADKHGG
jgi:long-chain acyl-CoA synthetase